MGRYIKEQYLDNLKLYKYSVIDVSPLSIYVLQPYWNYMIRFVPWGIAPNLITLLGTIGLFLNYLVVAYYIPLMEGNAPGWVFLLSAFAMEWYSLLDNLDGRQARRTQNSSPLGELFDHGCDCVAVAIGACTAASIFQFGSGERALVILIVMSMAFWLASWEEYHTKTFYLGFFNGPTEGLKILLLCYLWTYYAGVEFWLKDYRDILPLSPSLRASLPGYEIRDLCAFVFAIPAMVVTVYYNIKSVMTYLAKEKKSKLPALKQLLTFAVYFAMVVVWFYTSNPLWRTRPHVLHMAVGVGFAEMASRLILAHLCRMPYKLLQRPMLPLFVATAISASKFFIGKPLVPEEYLMYGYLSVAVLGWLHYAITVVSELCRYLNIKCLTLNPPKKTQ